MIFAENLGYQRLFFKWNSKYGGLSLSELERIEVLEAENSRLMKIVADQQLSIYVLIELNAKKW